MTQSQVKNVWSNAVRVVGCGLVVGQVLMASYALAAPSPTTTCEADNTTSAYTQLLALYAGTSDPAQQAIIEQATVNLNTCCSSLNAGLEKNNCLCSPGPYDLVSPTVATGSCNAKYTYP